MTGSVIVSSFIFYSDVSCKVQAIYASDIDMERSVQMAFCTVLSLAIRGLDVEKIRVEADVSNGLPMFHMVGYLSAEVKEASERVRTA